MIAIPAPGAVAVRGSLPEIRSSAPDVRGRARDIPGSSAKVPGILTASKARAGMSGGECRMSLAR